MINIKKLAKLAGVDVSTVSRALNDSSRVKPQTKAYIKELAEKHNYRPNDMARSLVGKRNFTIGVLIPELINTFYGEVIEGLESVFNARGYMMFFGNSRFDPEEEIKFVNMFIRRNVDGIVLCSTYASTFEYLKKLKRGIPVVLTDIFESYSDMDTVGIDHEAGIRAVIAHLRSLGHTRFAYIGDRIITPHRLNAFRTGLAEQGITLDRRHIFQGAERNEDGGCRRMKELLGLPDRDRPTAVFAGTDNLAVGAMYAAREAGLRLPADLSIVGFDDIMASAYAAVPLTTVRQPKREMGGAAAGLLLERIEDGSRAFQRIVLQPRLIVRETTAEPPHGKQA